MVRVPVNFLTNDIILHYNIIFTRFIPNVTLFILPPSRSREFRFTMVQAHKKNRRFQPPPLIGKTASYVSFVYGKPASMDIHARDIPMVYATRQYHAQIRKNQQLASKVPRRLGDVHPRKTPRRAALRAASNYNFKPPPCMVPDSSSSNNFSDCIVINKIVKPPVVPLPTFFSKVRLKIDPNDSVTIKRCPSCGTGTTPLWRKIGPHHHYCNACGIRARKYKAACVSCLRVVDKQSKMQNACSECLGNLNSIFI